MVTKTKKRSVLSDYIKKNRVLSICIHFLIYAPFWSWSLKKKHGRGSTNSHQKKHTYTHSYNNISIFVTFVCVFVLVDCCNGNLRRKKACTQRGLTRQGGKKKYIQERESRIHFFSGYIFVTFFGGRRQHKGANKKAWNKNTI